jgi:hypothetical protein
MIPPKNAAKTKQIAEYRWVFMSDSRIVKQAWIRGKGIQMLEGQGRILSITSE